MGAAENSQESLVGIWYTALGMPIGIVLQVSDFERFRQQMYQARTKHGDPELAGLQIRAWNEEGGNCVIVHVRPEARPSPGLLSVIELDGDIEK